MSENTCPRRNVPGALKFGCLPTAIGTLPDIDASVACRRVLRHLKEVPAWPQLPRRSPQENMYLQFAEGFPGLVQSNGSLSVDTSSPDFDAALESVYRSYLDGRVDDYAVSRERAEGLHEFLGNTQMAPVAVKGQVIGPISWGLMVTDAPGPAGRGIVYDDTLGDAVAKFLRMKASWQERRLRALARNTIVFLDEPYLTSLGSAFVTIPSERVAELIGEVLCGLEGIGGLHCCGRTEWPLLLSLPVGVISFDAYNYAGSMALYPGQVNDFFDRGGTMAWGIVPNDEEALARETEASLADRLGEAIAPFTRDGGLGFRGILEQSLLTPSCGLSGLSPEAADAALGLLAALSARMRRRL